MNHQHVSEICFEEIYVVPTDQTARSLFTRLPHGKAYAETLIECFATGYLIAVVESICIREMQRHIDPTAEVVVGRDIRIEHCGPIPSGAKVRLSGWVERLGNRSMAGVNYLDRRVASRRNVTRRPVVVSAPFFPLQSIPGGARRARPPSAAKFFRGCFTLRPA
jgi:predicted thioesterase